MKYSRELFLVAAVPALWWISTVALAQVPGQAGGTVDNPLAVHSLDRMSDTRDRPLFSPSRRPPPPPPPSVNLPVAPPPPPPSLILLGTVLEADEARAIVRVAPRNDLIRVRFGEEIAGWKVTQIEPRKLVLSLGDRSATFTLFSAPAKAPSGRMQSPERRIPSPVSPPIAGSR
jgi:hypothetical protein